MRGRGDGSGSGGSWAAGVVVLLCLALVGCDQGGGADRGGADPVDEGTVTRTDPTRTDPAGTTGPVTVRAVTDAYVLTLPVAATPRARAQDPGGCAVVGTHLREAGLEVYAVPRGCDLDGQQPLNGSHGSYRTVEDVLEPLAVEQVPTRPGEATVLEQRYTECTNECQTWDEPVAIITLDEPLDPDYPTVVVTSPKGQVDRAGLLAVLDQLRAG